MRFSLSLLALASLASSACAVEAEPTGESHQASTTSNCSSVPGCTYAMDASDGPVYASYTRFKDASGREREHFSVHYRERYNTNFLLCGWFVDRPALVFVTGPESARVSVERPLGLSCPTAYGDNPGATNSAYFQISADEDPELWNTLFPAAVDGSRWFAVQVALRNAFGAWDSRYGHNYRLVLRPR